MRKMKAVFAALAAVILLVSACGAAGAEQGPRQILSAADAEEWLTVFLGRHPEALEGAWAITPQMEEAAAQAGGFRGFALQMALMGGIREIGPAREGELQGYKTFRVPCVFLLQSVDLTLVVQDGALAGLRIDPFSGVPEPEDSAAFASAALALPVPGLGELPGLLTLPRGEGPFPAVVLLPGSGPSDMDETVGNLKPFRDIAEGLAAQGIAAYRFHKRTYVYGAQLAEKKDFTLEDEYLEDAVSAVRLLSQQPGIDPDRIFVLGHSLGGNAVPAVARRLKQEGAQACGYIMMAASLRPLDVLMREQYDFLYSLMPEVTAAQQAEKDALFAELDRLRDPDSLAEDDMIAGAYAPYWKWLAGYDVLREAEEMDRPVLLLPGEEDYQVPMEDFRLWQEALGDQSGWRMTAYPGLTHLFTPGRKTEGASAYARDGRVQEQVILDIASFILETGRPQGRH